MHRLNPTTVHTLNLKGSSLPPTSTRSARPSTHSSSPSAPTFSVPSPSTTSSNQKARFPPRGRHWPISRLSAGWRSCSCSGYLQAVKREVNLLQEMVKALDAFSGQQSRLIVVRFPCNTFYTLWIFFETTLQYLQLLFSLSYCWQNKFVSVLVYLLVWLLTSYREPVPT